MEEKNQRKENVEEKIVEKTLKEILNTTPIAGAELIILRQFFNFAVCMDISKEYLAVIAGFLHKDDAQNYMKSTNKIDDIFMLVSLSPDYKSKN